MIWRIVGVTVRGLHGRRVSTIAGIRPINPHCEIDGPGGFEVRSLLLKIAAYLQPHRTEHPTGVGKHIINMLRCFAQADGVNLTAFSARDLLTADGRLPDYTGLATLPTLGFPQSRRIMEWSWTLFRRPLADQWCPGADWIYCPADVFIPSGRAKTAATCHSVVDFERDFPAYGSWQRRRARLRWWPILKAIMSRTDLIFSVSEHLKGRLVDLFDARPEKVVVVGNGVETEYFLAAEKPRDASAVPYLITVGGLSPQKNARCVLGVARELLRKKSPLQIWVAGNGEAALEHEALSLENVRLLGYKGVSELPGLVRNATAALFVSRYESFGIPAAEAMAAGTPVVVSQWYGLPAIVGPQGLVVDGDSVKQSTDLCLRLFEDSEFREVCAARGREQARGFTWEQCARKALRAMGC